MSMDPTQLNWLSATEAARTGVPRIGQENLG